MSLCACVTFPAARRADGARPVGNGLVAGIGAWRGSQGCSFRPMVQVRARTSAGNFGQRISLRIIAFAVHVLHRRHGSSLPRSPLGIGFASTLQIGIDQKIHGVKLMAFAAHVHGRGLARGGDGGEVGIDVILPQARGGQKCATACAARAERRERSWRSCGPRAVPARPVAACRNCESDSGPRRDDWALR